MLKLALFAPVTWIAMTWPEAWTGLIVLGGGSAICLAAARLRIPAP